MKTLKHCVKTGLLTDLITCVYCHIIVFPTSCNMPWCCVPVSNRLQQFVLFHCLSKDMYFFNLYMGFFLVFFTCTVAPF